MAVNQIVEFLETGNIKNSVNFPNVQLKRTTDYRISIINKNVPAMIGQIATALGELNLNIAEMTNVSKGDIAYNLIDVENPVDEASIAKLKEIENVIDVRLNQFNLLSYCFIYRFIYDLKPTSKRFLH